MALVLGDNFSYGGAKPLDARLKYNTLAEMKAVADSTMYNGCTAYCEEADKTYQWKSTNTVDEDTGRWREFTSGSSTGGGHTIEDSEGTDLTQRDTLQFGEGFKAEDDDINEKTVISPDVMQSGDMDDVITPLPSVANKLPVLIDLSEAEKIVGWSKYTNGTKKPIYQKTFTVTLGSTSDGNWESTQVNVSGWNIDSVVDIHCMGHTTTGNWITLDSMSITNGGYIIKTMIDNNKTTFTIWNNATAYSGSTIYATIQYTKTTD